MERTGGGRLQGGGRFSQCPGVEHLVAARDGLLARFRVAGALSKRDLLVLSELAAAHGDGVVHLTSRAGVQIRGIKQPESWRGAVRAARAKAGGAALAWGEFGAVLMDWANATATEIAAAREVSALLVNYSGHLSPRFSVCLDIGGSGFASFFSDITFAEREPFAPRGSSGTASYDVRVAGQWLPRSVSCGDIARCTAEIIGDNWQKIAACGGRLRGGGVVRAGAGSPQIYGGRRQTRSGEAMQVIAPKYGRLARKQVLAIAAAASDNVKFYLLPWRAIAAVSDRGEQLEGLAAVSRGEGLASLGQSLGEDRERLVIPCSGSRGCHRGRYDTIAVAEEIARSGDILPGLVHVSGCARGCAWGAAADWVIMPRAELEAAGGLPSFTEPPQPHRDGSLDKVFRAARAEVAVLRHAPPAGARAS